MNGWGVDLTLEQVEMSFEKAIESMGNALFYANILNEFSKKVAYHFLLDLSNEIYKQLGNIIEGKKEPEDVLQLVVNRWNIDNHK